ncbi:hypothetical protein [Chryseobacterium sp.]|uniref:hypothetical protein n=1 Tax=Chryseobacterium sp. TaxID=1871047 RepID=UPI00289FE11C|nr:hypothetical protein [Chryseobacterium sp.]
MKRFEINKLVGLYFGISWIVALLLIFATLFGLYEDGFYLLIFISWINIIINSIAIVVLLLFYYVFSENRIEFRNSAVLLLFNFPNMIVLYFFISII